ncbi:hypothetical protein HMPREF9088_0211 [Enterococcus italicus DSM 15952]|uniref:Uncharacterized protein n=1 Tax=Enterococcus italicus (strain DSM 15952 / CCUG 50447 / LMG 22039 / TP 1.5) TaxID=888064 RepID=E6LCX1_ENTI1|nr:hypothetical protein HMPREF9088_0211 [Enterococcus italicus DSM 15952]OJG58826.1 osmolarity sensor protein EnvZ [Enterococcus italicus DSM 15952]
MTNFQNFLRNEIYQKNILKFSTKNADVTLFLRKDTFFHLGFPYYSFSLKALFFTQYLLKKIFSDLFQYKNHDSNKSWLSSYLIHSCAALLCGKFDLFFTNGKP